MRLDVQYAGAEVGTLDWLPDAYGVQVELDCARPTGAPPLLRCYGQTAGAPLLIGLPAPQQGRLRLSRHLSRETLKAAGCAQTAPQRCYLAERPEPTQTPVPARPDRPVQAPAPPLRTGDQILDALLDNGAVHVAPAGDALLLSCTFAPDAPFALAPACVRCTVAGGRATLRWTKQDAAQAAASQQAEEKVT
ncbi:MAG: hypothetical protein Q4D31_07195 [Eubacteriales bacterium]|nr:hypothetical protein [Eubacteriales bacterium]